MSWLLDTCVLSEYARKAPASNVIAWLDEQEEASLFISVISLGEIEKGILKLRASDARRSQKLTAWLGKVEQRFAGRILPLDTAALHVWAQLAAHAELAGKALPVMDGLLMAITQCHGLTVVTRNVQDFAYYPQVLNPWEL
jgi:predicted nucleic acid-binding protein